MLDVKILNDVLNEIEAIEDAIASLKNEYRYFKNSGAVDVVQSLAKKIIKLTMKKRRLEKQLTEYEKLIYNI